ncbi:uncharacterized protein EDB91DRAFT_1078275 [Suillus paluster]|uniref:uncharacterized protein n=1 Tax=Suillus paluster TaxID=48578 RepID=UPI001B87E4D1|nr:uncharacterized protein EDB91DRAFT_1078275 [Suillus paluster]KAG1751505.1 hypothetical protein EDB91DRAFT_1078275 [Suillus paluster]
MQAGDEPSRSCRERQVEMQNPPPLQIQRRNHTKILGIEYLAPEHGGEARQRWLELVPVNVKRKSSGQLQLTKLPLITSCHLFLVDHSIRERYTPQSALGCLTYEADAPTNEIMLTDENQETVKRRQLFSMMFEVSAPKGLERRARYSAIRRSVIGLADRRFIKDRRAGLILRDSRTYAHTARDLLVYFRVLPQMQQ